MEMIATERSEGQKRAQERYLPRMKPRQFPVIVLENVRESVPVYDSLWHATLPAVWLI
jgi:hypothetical protein